MLYESKLDTIASCNPKIPLEKFISSEMIIIPIDNRRL